MRTVNGILYGTVMDTKAKPERRWRVVRVPGGKMKPTPVEYTTDGREAKPAAFNSEATCRRFIDECIATRHAYVRILS